MRKVNYSQKHVNSYLLRRLLLKILSSLSSEEQKQSQIIFYNPNLYPREEFNARLQAVKKVVKSLDPDIKIFVENYLPQDNFHALATNRVNQ
jgi:predicted adenine nucleotide alpha hydrolase (AANH) superfamily ATPase